MYTPRGWTATTAIVLKWNFSLRSSNSYGWDPGDLPAAYPNIKLSNVYVVYCSMFADYAITCVTFCVFARWRANIFCSRSRATIVFAKCLRVTPGSIVDQLPRVFKFSTAGRVKHVVILPTSLQKKSLNVHVYTARLGRDNRDRIKIFPSWNFSLRYSDSYGWDPGDLPAAYPNNKLSNVYVVHYSMFADYTITCVTFCAFARWRDNIFCSRERR